MSETKDVINAMIKSGIASRKLVTILEMLNNNYKNDIYVDPETQLVTLYDRDMKISYPFLIRIQDLITEACNVAIALKITPEQFHPVGLALDRL